MSKEMKIAKIISNEAVVINAGSNDGIEKEQKFQIIGKVGLEPVIDPDTGESLGTLDELKGIVIAKNVYPNMTVAETEMHRAGGTVDYTDMFKGISSTNNVLFGPYVHTKLNVDSDQITGGIQDSTDPIKVGDIVTKI